MQEAFRTWCQRNQIEPATETSLQRIRSSTYLTKIKVSDAEMVTVLITPHPSHGEWNDTAFCQSSDILTLGLVWCVL